MSNHQSDGDKFEEKLRSVLQDLGRSAEKAAHGNVEAIAEAVGVEPAKAQQWLDGVAKWLGGQASDATDAETGAPDATGAAADARPARSATAPPRGAEPHPLDTPTPEQGVALAALDSGRWSIEPGSHALSTHGQGPGPIDALGLFGELRARDWITGQGEVTVVGRHALGRWLESQ